MSDQPGWSDPSGEAELQGQLARIRAETIDRLWLGMLAVALIGVPVSVARSAYTGWLGVYTAHIVTGILIVAVFIVRRRLSPGVKVAALMLVTPVEIADVPSATVVQGLFDLTPAEAKVARGLASGLTVHDIAGTHGTSATTVRNQVRAVFAKTGMHRQADLVGLLRGIRPLR